MEPLFSWTAHDSSSVVRLYVTTKLQNPRIHLTLQDLALGSQLATPELLLAFGDPYHCVALKDSGVLANELYSVGRWHSDTAAIQPTICLVREGAAWHSKLLVH